jgi:hypothetical protein
MLANLCDIILKKLDAGLSGQHLSGLRGDHSFAGSYSSVWRFRATCSISERVSGMECEPGEAQVDFGSGVPVVSEEGRAQTHVFRIVLLQPQAWQVFRRLESLINALENAFCRRRARHS